MADVSQSTDFSFKELTLVLQNGEILDIASIFDELNLYDNIFSPCLSGSILLTDANSIAEKLKFDGQELPKIRILIDKTGEPIEALRYQKQFVIYNMSKKSVVNLTTQRYTLYFCSEEFPLSLQKKVNQHYKAPYHEIVKKILTDYLKVPNGKPTNGKAGIGKIQETRQEFLFDMPTLTPFDSINWISKRAIADDSANPDFLFFELQRVGYNFRSLKTMFEDPVKFLINFNPKNLNANPGSEFLSARELKILSQYSVLENVKGGSYAGNKLLFDTYTREFRIVPEEDIHSSSVKVGKSNLPEEKNLDNKSYKEMHDSRIVAHPYFEYRKDRPYLKEQCPENLDFLDNPEQYIYKRKPIFTNLMQRRIQLLMPGNFGLNCSQIITLFVPKYSIKQEDEVLDKTLSGKYIIIGTRHIIRYDKHQTLLEVATDKIQS